MLVPVSGTSGPDISGTPTAQEEGHPQAHPAPYVTDRLAKVYGPCIDWMRERKTGKIQMLNPVVDIPAYEAYKLVGASSHIVRSSPWT